jgi:hypothetical protein
MGVRKLVETKRFDEVIPFLNHSCRCYIAMSCYSTAFGFAPSSLRQTVRQRTDLMPMASV